MFEKEAQRSFDELDDRGIGDDWSIEESYVNGFSNGAEFGYNKANEWHKPSEKLPEECSLVLAYAFYDTVPSMWEFVTSDQWEGFPKGIVFCSNDQIRLWKEIVLPELKESE